MVTIDDVSAARLVAEGATWLDTDTREATSEGHTVNLDHADHLGRHPVLVTGTSERAVTATIARLEQAGPAAWWVPTGSRP